MRLDLPVGVGKSYMLDYMVAEASEQGLYDFIIVLMPTRKLIEERRFILNPPQDTCIVNIRPRPVADCGEERNITWSWYERQGLGLLGRNELCDVCDNQDTCFWLSQYGTSLAGTDIVYAAQAHLEIMPDFIETLQGWV